MMLSSIVLCSHGPRRACILRWSFVASKHVALKVNSRYLENVRWFQWNLQFQQNTCTESDWCVAKCPLNFSFLDIWDNACSRPGWVNGSKNSRLWTFSKICDKFQWPSACIAGLDLAIHVHLGTQDVASFHDTPLLFVMPWHLKYVLINTTWFSIL